MTNQITGRTFSLRMLTNPQLRKEAPSHFKKGAVLLLTFHISLIKKGHLYHQESVIIAPYTANPSQSILVM